MAINEISKNLQNDIGIERFKEVFMNNLNSKAAQILGIGISTVSLYAKQLSLTKDKSSTKKGNKPSTKKDKCTKAHGEIIESLYHNIAMGEIANKIKVNKGALYTYVQKNGGKVKLIEEYKLKKVGEVKDFYDNQKENGNGQAPDERFKINEDEDMNVKLENYCNEQGDVPFLEKDLMGFYDEFVAENELALADDFLQNFINYFKTRSYIIPQSIIDEVFELCLMGVNREDIHNRTGYPKDDIDAIWDRYLGNDERLQANTHRATNVLKEFNYSVEDTVELTGLSIDFVQNVCNEIAPTHPVLSDEEAETAKENIAKSVPVAENEPMQGASSITETPLERKKRLQAELAEVEAQMTEYDLETIRANAKAGLEDLNKCLLSLENCTLDAIGQFKFQIESIENTFKSATQSYRQKIANMHEKLG